MNISLIILIIILQIITIYLDNKTNMFDFFQKVSLGNVASAYTNRGITLTISRTLFYAVPPLLGYLILSADKTEMQYLMICVSLINFILTFTQSKIYSNYFKINIIEDSFKFKDVLFKFDFFIGVLAFMFFLITPYILNYIALLMPSQGLWVVQLNAAFNSFLTLYVIIIFEPKVAKKIDKKNNYEKELFEAIAVRLLGRFFIILLILISIYLY